MKHVEIRVDGSIPMVLTIGLPQGTPDDIAEALVEKFADALKHSQIDLLSMLREFGVCHEDMSWGANGNDV